MIVHLEHQLARLQELADAAMRDRDTLLDALARRRTHGRRLICRYPTVSIRQGRSGKPPPDHIPRPVCPINQDDARLPLGGFLVRHCRVSSDNNQVADACSMGRRTIDLNASRPDCAFHDVGLEARSIAYVVDLDLLVWSKPALSIS